MGINVPILKVQIFVLSSVFASVGGSFYAHYVTFINPEAFSMFLSVLLITMIALGGIANLWGAVIGAIALTFLSEYLKFFQEYYLLIYGGTLGLVMIFFPDGFSDELPRFWAILKKWMVRSRDLSTFIGRKPTVGSSR